jgi:hypothetical protein
MNDTKPHRMPMELWSMLPSQLQGDVIGGIAKQGRFFQKKKLDLQIVLHILLK